MKTSITKGRRVTPRVRLAFHEAGHAVLSAAINDLPRYITIRRSGSSLGRSEQKISRDPSIEAQVCLAGHAAEEVLIGYTPRQYRSWMALAVAYWAAALPAPERLADFDCFKAVQQAAQTANPTTADDLSAEVERFYKIAKLSLSSVWPTVEAVANALIANGELGQDEICDVFGEHEIYDPVFDVQRAHGLLP